MEFRQRTIQMFSIVFNEPTEGEEQKPTVDNDFASNWSWYGIIYRLTNKDITKLNKITNTSLYECLTWLTYESELDLQENNSI